MENILRNGQLTEMLELFGKVVKQFEIDFFLVGAIARDIKLSADPNFASQRLTKDVDILV